MGTEKVGTTLRGSIRRFASCSSATPGPVTPGSSPGTLPLPALAPNNDLDRDPGERCGSIRLFGDRYASSVRR